MSTTYNTMNDPDDVFRWPDGVWCYRTELDEYGHKSDDYELIKFGSSEWDRLHETGDHG